MPKTVLLVEDSEDDVFFIRRAFKKAGLLAPIYHVEDGHRAVAYLSGAGEYADRARFPLPSVVLLDIKLPFMSGFEVLRWIRQESNYPTTPVVMFTSSDQDCDVEKAYASGANAYLMKPDHAEVYSELAVLIKRFWLEANYPPPPRENRPAPTESLPASDSVPVPVRLEGGTC